MEQLAILLKALLTLKPIQQGWKIEQIRKLSLERDDFTRLGGWVIWVNGIEAARIPLAGLSALLREGEK